MASNEIKKSSASSILVVIILIALSLISVSADTSANVLQTHITEQIITIITDTKLSVGELKCSVSNQNAEVTASGLFSDENTSIKTTLLIDISTSIPRDMRGEVIAVLKKLIENKAGNEEFRIIVFGEELNTLQDFSSDRYDLANAADQIVFDGAQSIIYDAIYNTMPSMTAAAGKPTLYRTVVITDGVDDTMIGITKEELFIKLQNERYPVDVVAVSGSESSENRELAAIVRMSCGRYNALNPGTDIETLADTLRVSDYYYIEAKVPHTLLDGSIRQVDISDGINNMSVDVKFPVFSVNEPITDPEPVTTKKPDSTDPATQNTHGAKTPEVTDDTADKASPLSGLLGDNTIVILIGAGAVLLIVAAIVIASAVTRGKKKKAVPQPSHVIPASYAAPVNYPANSSAEKTEFFGAVNPFGAQYTIKLSDLNDPGKTWTLPVAGGLLVGRADYCPIKFDDKSVSREQCKIIVQGTGLALTHMGSTNKTMLNGKSVEGNLPVQSGDILKFGRAGLRIEYIQALGTPPLRPDFSPGQRSGKTESLF